MVDAHLLVLLRIERLDVRHPFAALSIPVGVEDERRPALRLALVPGLLVEGAVEPAAHRRSDDPGAGPDHVVLVELEMVGREAGADERPLIDARLEEREMPVR